MGRVFIIGCGYVGKRIAALCRERGDGVSALCRKVEGCRELEALCISPVPGDLDDPGSLRSMPTAGAVVYYCAPPPGGGITEPRVQAFCSAIPAGAEPARLVYLSTTGVYGDCGGAVVTEESPVHPETTRAQRRVHAEETLTAWGAERGVPVIILRVPGIYGPGRLPIPQLQSGQPVLRSEDAPFSNRIHADDLAAVCLAAAARCGAGGLYNVGDGQESTMTDYFNAVAEAAGFPPPRQVTLEEARQVMHPLMLSYFSESRRVDVGKMQRELGVSLCYPTLEEGLRASLRQ
jgi:nucleoside-diphosphate-sugar epimerase